MIRNNQSEIRQLESRLRLPRIPRLDTERLRAALEQRAEQWKADLQAVPQIARLVLRRIVGPISLWDESKVPQWVRWKATPSTELLDGLVTYHVASPKADNPFNVDGFIGKFAA